MSTKRRQPPSNRIKNIEEGCHAGSTVPTHAVALAPRGTVALIVSLIALVVASPSLNARTAAHTRGGRDAAHFNT